MNFRHFFYRAYLLSVSFFSLFCCSFAPIPWHAIPWHCLRIYMPRRNE